MQSHRFLPPLFCLAALLVVSGAARAANSDTPELKSAPFAPRSGASTTPHFVKIEAEDSGLKVSNPYDDPAMWGERYQEFSQGAIGTGLAIGDVDGDGLPDIYIVNKTKPNQLFKNLGGFKFRDISDEAKAPGGTTWKTGATMADVNNDGALDIYICQFNAPNLLYINDGKGHFTEQGHAAGLDLVSGSVVGAFCDYDRDGYLDLFVLTNVLDAAKSPDGEVSHLYHNNGNGTFTDVTATCGISKLPSHGHSSTWFDYNGDGWPDLYVSSDFTQPDHLYRNNGDGTFTDVTEEALPYTPWSSMGSDFGDINNDGRFDYFAADMSATTHYKSKVNMGDMGGIVNYMDTLVTPQYMKNAVYLNSGTNRFLEISKFSGLGSTDWTWSPRFEDLDNDGWVDLHVTNGMVRDFIHSDLLNKAKKLSSKEEVIALFKNSPVMNETNLTYRNDGNLHFTKVGAAWGLDHNGVSFGSAFADLDGDGDMDIVYTNFDQGVTLYRNDCPAQNRSIEVFLEGEKNRFGVGAEVFAYTSAGRQSRMLSVARGVLSSSEPMLHFGLGADTEVKKLEVRWPSGKVQTFEHLAADRRYHVTESSACRNAKEDKACDTRIGVAVTDRTPKSGLFTDISACTGLDYVNKEKVFDDMTRQSLLPHKMNTLGEGATWADFNGDGIMDLFLAGAAGNASALYLGDGKGGFQRSTRAQPWDALTGTEFMSAAAMDVNQDGTPDLLLIAGGVEAEPGSDAYASRLFLNDGKAAFREAAPESFSLPPFSAGACASADFTHSGSLGVFIGGRVLPGDYPRMPRSFLLENKGGKLVDVTPEAISKLGMVTSATWADVDHDGWPDLIVTGEWMPLRIFRNDHPGFTEITQQCGLQEVTGWWNSVVPCDVNNDGILDFVVGNVGKNTKYKADKVHPAGLYYFDFEGKGRCQVIESKFEGDRLIPVRGRSCSSQAMPKLKDKFPTYHEFASAILPEIYGDEQLKNAIHLEATELASGVFIGGKDGRYQFKAFPNLAQVAPVFGMAVADFNGDGNPDIVLGQNFRGPQVETGRYDGALSLLLIGDGKGQFRALDPQESGVAIPGEVRSVSLTDLDQDGWPDLLLTRVNEPVLALHSSVPTGAKSTVLRLSQPGSNPDALGATVDLVYKDGSRRTAVIASHSGYMTQNPPVVFVTCTASLCPETVEITWPDGKKSCHPFEAPGASVLITRPSSL